MRRAFLIAACAALAFSATAPSAIAASASALAADSKAALERLYAANPKARELGERSRAILVFPRIVKAGLLVGGLGGDGALIVDFDEAADSDTTNGGGHISPVFWGPTIKTGYTQTSTTLYQHQSMLRTIMDVLGLPNPPAAAATAPPMSEFFVQY